MKSPNQNAFDQFTLRSLFLFVSVLAVCFVMIRVGLQLGIFTRPGMAAIGCVTVLGLVKWLLKDHEWRIEQGKRKPFDIASVALFLTISGLVAMFLWLLPNAVTWAIPFFTAAKLSLETSPVSFLVGSF